MDAFHYEITFNKNIRNRAVFLEHVRAIVTVGLDKVILPTGDYLVKSVPKPNEAVITDADGKAYIVFASQFSNEAIASGNYVPRFEVLDKPKRMGR